MAAHAGGGHTKPEDRPDADVRLSFAAGLGLLRSSADDDMSNPTMSKPARSFPRPLSEYLGAAIGGVLKEQGFASTEILARWADIVGPEIAAHSEPMKINWPRVKSDAGDTDQGEPATLVLRVEGPAALEIQHLSAVILERVNRFFGWQAIGRLALRQAPLRRVKPKMSPPPPDPAVVARIAEGLPEIENDDLRQALGRLGAAIKRK
jgi:hypothetical protein